MAQPTKSRNKAVSRSAAETNAKRNAPAKAVHAASPKAAVSASRPTPGLHYNRDDLHTDYSLTYRWFMVALAVGIVGALIYFFGMIIYLGAVAHTPTDDYVREFGSRIQYDYKGLRLPEYDDPSLLDQKKPAEGHH